MIPSGVMSSQTKDTCGRPFARTVTTCALHGDSRILRASGWISMGMGSALLYSASAVRGGSRRFGSLVGRFVSVAGRILPGGGRGVGRDIPGVHFEDDCAEEDNAADERLHVDIQ